MTAVFMDEKKTAKLKSEVVKTERQVEHARKGVTLSY